MWKKQKQNSIKQIAFSIISEIVYETEKDTVGGFYL